MKTFQEIIDTFEKDLKKAGITSFVLAVKNPDSQDTYWNCGSDVLWQRGAIAMLKDRHKDFCDAVDAGEGIDEQGDDWKTG